MRLAILENEEETELDEQWCDECKDTIALCVHNTCAICCTVCNDSKDQ